MRDPWHARWEKLRAVAPAAVWRTFDDRRQRGAAARRTPDRNAPAAPQSEGPATRSIVEVDMLVVNDRPLLVLHDVVAVQTVAVLIEIVFAFRAGHFLGGKDRLADFPGIGRAGLVDRRRQDGNGIVRPGALVIRRGLVGVAIGLAEGLRSLAGIFRVVRNPIGATQRWPRQLGR